jgi:hypothetical protein
MNIIRENKMLLVNEVGFQVVPRRHSSACRMRASLNGFARGDGVVNGMTPAGVEPAFPTSQ